MQSKENNHLINTNLNAQQTNKMNFTFMQRLTDIYHTSVYNLDTFVFFRNGVTYFLTSPVRCKANGCTVTKKLTKRTSLVYYFRERKETTKTMSKEYETGWAERS